MAGLDASDDWTALLPAPRAGVGVGLTNPALATAAVGVVPPQRAGMASGVDSTFRQVGIATGIAAWGAIFQHLVDGQAQAFGAAVGRSGPPAGASGSFSDFISFGIYHRLGPNATAPGREAFLHGLNQHPRVRRDRRLHRRRRERAAHPPAGLRVARRGDLAAAGGVDAVPPEADAQPDQRRFTESEPAEQGRARLP